MCIKELTHRWNNVLKEQKEPLEEDMQFKTTSTDAAKIKALAQMYASGDEAVILKDLVHAALKDIESNFPYVAGSTVIGEDELGDPLYEDVGPTPQYLELVKSNSAK